MCTPVGHSIAGGMIFAIAKRFNPQGRYTRRELLVFMALAVLPDIDILIQLGPFSGARLHRTYSHSLLFAVVIGLLAAYLFKRFKHRSPSGRWLFYPLAILTHPLLDIMCVETFRPGVQFWWPFSHQWVYYPMPLLTSVGTFHALHTPMIPAFFESAVMEFAVVGSVAMLLLVVLRYLPNTTNHLPKL